MDRPETSGAACGVDSRAWPHALLALAVLAVDPAGLGGLVVRARSGPVRDRFAARLGMLDQPLIHLHPALSDDALDGGLDLSATLAAGRPVQHAGLLAGRGSFLLAMAERCPPRTSARLACALDEAGAGADGASRTRCLIAFDEGAETDEVCPAKLAERCAFAVDLTGVSLADARGGAVPGSPTAIGSGTTSGIAAARAALPGVSATDDDLRQMALLAAAFGIDSLRAPLFALRAARAHAALFGRNRVCPDDLEAACTLTLAHRATRLPQDENVPAPAPDQDRDPAAPRPDAEMDDDALPDEMLVAAVMAMVPADLLARLAQGKAARAKGAGSGAARRGNRRGRPLPPRQGAPGAGSRIDIVATLRAAAPWQRLRALTGAVGGPRAAGLHIRPSDIRVKQYEERSDRLLIFAVDASGSSALARLAEVKGAVELLLAQAYARRDHVALIGFRGAAAEVLLPPTRSLVQTKRRLAGLPGGGATPLAAGLQGAFDLAALATRRGLSPNIILLTDGRANIALDGTADRVQATADALRVAAALRGQGVRSLVIDTGTRPEPGLQHLALTMGGTYLPLPRADARRLSGTVSAALDG